MKTDSMETNMTKMVDQVLDRMDAKERHRIAGLRGRVTLLDRKLTNATRRNRWHSMNVLGRQLADTKEALKRAEDFRDHSGWL